MKQTVIALEGEVGKSKAYIARAQGQSEATGAIGAKGATTPNLLEAVD
jgi:hypothetical protein